MDRRCLIAVAALLSCTTIFGLGAQPKKILFIGNCLTYSNWGLGYLLEKLAASAEPAMNMKCDDSTTGEEGLRLLWANKNRHDMILNGHYDIVVLQGVLVGNSAAYDSERDFREYAKKFNEEVQRTGAYTVLLMHWRLSKSAGEPFAMSDIERIHTEVSNELNVEVAPVGLAWLQSEGEHPDLPLYDRSGDGVHPELRGSYLAACVLYATLFKKSPVGLSYIADEINNWAGGGKRMTPQDADFLQRIAWTSVLKYPPANVGEQ